MNLFCENLGSAETDEDITLIQKQFPSYDRGYICQSAGLRRREEKEWMEELWKQYEIYADPHFPEEFKRHFLQRSWELYLGVTLLSRGFKLGKHISSGPDFDVQNNKNERLCWLEAVTPGQGSGKDRVPDPIYNIAQELPETKMLLRITNALDDKFKQYQVELAKNIVKEQEPYIIAINRSGVGFIDPGIPLILKAIFGIGDLTLNIRVNGVRQKNPESFWSSRPKITKQNGTDISMLFFSDVTKSGISAVIYCADGILDSPRLPQEMGKNFVIIHNPLAKNPLPKKFFPFGEEY